MEWVCCKIERLGILNQRICGVLEVLPFSFVHVNTLQEPSPVPSLGMAFRTMVTENKTYQNKSL